MAALANVALRPAEAPDQEVPQPDAGVLNLIRRIHRAEDVVVRDLRVEGLGEALEAVLSEDFVEIGLHVPIFEDGEPAARSPGGMILPFMRLSCQVTLLAALVLAFAPGGPADEGFEPLFDGESLDGWVLLGKRGEGYVVRDGAITCSKGSGGNLLSASEYQNFVLRFEFRLESGSNNGLCIRCPLTWGDMAYIGNELQIIDNSAPRYKNIKPWQKHGSLYDVAPAGTGALRPVGEWNSQEVTASGTTIRVVLNGTEILSVDTQDVTDREKLARHPGLARSSGHIGFLGHNEPVQFRNIRIKALP